jgi:hypothetical protein
MKIKYLMILKILKNNNMIKKLLKNNNLIKKLSKNNNKLFNFYLRNLTKL